MKHTTSLIVVTLAFLGLTVFLFGNVNQQFQKEDKPEVLAATSYNANANKPLNVVAVQPASGSLNNALSQKIVITFSHDVASTEASFSIAPTFSYNLSYLGNVISISPNEALLPGTTYTYVVKYADKNLPTKTYTFQTVGPTQKYLPDTKPTAAVDELNSFQRQNHPDVFLANHTPYRADTFSISSNYREGSDGHFYFVVNLRSNLADKGKSDFMNWLTSLKLEDEQIQKLDIDYRK